MNARYMIQRAKSFMEAVNNETSQEDKELDKLEDRNILIKKNHKQGFYTNKESLEKIEDLEKDVNDAIEDK